MRKQSYSRYGSARVVKYCLDYKRFDQLLDVIPDVTPGVVLPVGTLDIGQVKWSSDLSVASTIIPHF